MEKFAGYGFNKSHSAAYAYLAFVTAYLKAHYPLEFMSALLTSETGNTAQVVKYINECREMGIRVLAPDVNSSDFDFTPAHGRQIRFGLGAIKNVGANAVESIVKTRARDGRFGSLYDFCERVDLGAVNRRMIESFIKAGAMDTLDGTRAQLTAIIDSAMETGMRASKDRESGQSGLFAALMEEQPASEHPLAERSGLDRPGEADAEKEMLGFLHHRASAGRSTWTRCGSFPRIPPASWKGWRRGTEVALCGILTGVERRRNKEGKLWASMKIEDLEGAVEANGVLHPVRTSALRC